jgi:hypothetical protein
MVKRKKRLIKGIESLKRQIEIHKNKRDKARKSKNEELERYYEKEIKSKQESLENKKDILNKQ